MNQKTEDANWGRTAVTFVLIWTNRRKRFAHLETPVHTLIIQLRNFTILRCTRQNFAKAIPVALGSVNMAIFAHLPIQNLKFQLIWLSAMSEMQTSTCFISKQLGVRTKKKSISGKFVSMLIIGRTIAVNLISTPTRCNSAERGTLKIKL